MQTSTGCFRETSMEQVTLRLQSVRTCLSSWIRACVFSLLAFRGTSAQVGQVIDLRCPGKGIERIQAYGGGTSVAPVSFLGDLDGDGIDDFADHWKTDSPCGAVVFGSPNYRFSSGVDLSAVRHVKLTGGEELACLTGGIPVGAGDVDGDRFGDFLKGLAGLSWGGVEKAGLVVLIYGSKDLPTEIDLGNLGGAGIRFARFSTRRELSNLGFVQGRAGDLNGDGYGELYFSWNVPGTENGASGAGGVYVVRER